MTRYLFPAWLSFAAFTSFATPCFATTPQVTTDITPVYGLVAQVMKGVATPSLVIRAGSDPHHYSLRPSEAANIQQADIIFWMGPELTPWLKPALRNLAGNADSISLLHVSGITVLEAGKDGHHHGAARDEHDSDDDHDKHNHDGHADHSDHSDHASTHQDSHDHDHKHSGHDNHNKHDHHNDKEAGYQALDPHAWLDPENARIWIKVVAEELSHHDPANASRYQANASAADQEIIRQQTRIETILATGKMPPIFVQHAAFAYFENRFSIEMAGALYDRENEAPSPAHIAQLHKLTEKMPKACLLAETMVENNVIRSVFDHTDLLVRQVNPSGLAGAAPENAYIDLLTRLADSLEDCARH